MMKLTYSKTLNMVLALTALIFSAGCQVEDGESDLLAREKRFFNLYISHNYNDSLSADASLYYKEIEPGTGDSPGAEDWILLNYVGYTIPDERVVDTYLENVASSNNINDEEILYGPFKMKNGSRTQGLAEGLQMMKEGGKAIICYTSDLGYGSKGVSLMKSVGNYASMKYEVELLSVLGEDIEAYEKERLENYANDIPGVDTIYDATEDVVMYYVIDDSVRGGQEVVEDSVVSIAYKGYLIDGRVFDESVEGAPYDLTVGDLESTIAGWSHGAKKFRLGEKGRLFIPYQLAYGENGRLTSSGNAAIPQYEPLIFDIEIVDIKEAEDGSSGEE